MNSAGVLQYMDVMLFGSRGFWGLRLHKCWFGIEGIDLVVWVRGLECGFRTAAGS